jgi:hypothetical protein
VPSGPLSRSPTSHGVPAVRGRFEAAVPPPCVSGRVWVYRSAGSSRTSLADVRVVSIGMPGPMVWAMVIERR